MDGRTMPIRGYIVTVNTIPVIGEMAKKAAQQERTRIAAEKPNAAVRLVPVRELRPLRARDFGINYQWHKG